MAFHIKRNSRVEECKKAEGLCKLEEHFESAEEAEARVSEMMAQEYSLIPDVVYSHSIPTDDVVEYLSHNHSELLVALHVIMNEAEPIVTVGMNMYDEPIYHCYYELDDTYSDITGVVAFDVDSLDTYTKETYTMSEESYGRADSEQSQKMIESLLGFSLDDENALGKLVIHIESLIEKSKDTSLGLYNSCMYILKIIA